MRVCGDRVMAMSPLRFVETTALHLGYELGDPRHADIAERIVALPSISVPAIALAGVCKGRHLGRSSRSDGRFTEPRERGPNSVGVGRFTTDTAIVWH